MLSHNSVDTPLVEKSKLDEDLQGKPVNATLYRGMIVSIMYLTSSRPTLLMQSAYVPDHAGCQDSRRSTSGSAQFLGEKLIMVFNSIRFLFTATTKVQLLYVATPFNIQEPSTLIIIYTTRAYQKALDDELVSLANRLKIGKCNLRLSFNLNSKEPALQVTVSRHHSLLRFKINGKSHTVNVDNFRDMLQIYPILPSHKFKDPPFEEEILSFIRELGHTGEIKVLSDVNGMYHNKNVDYVYLLWEDLVFQVENKNSKKNNDMYYPCITKVIVNYVMAKDKSIPKRNKMFWHFARDESMFTIIKVISKHQDTHVYGALLPQHLTNQAMLDSKAYKTYHAYATGGSSADEGTGVSPGVPDAPTYDFDDEQICWKLSDNEDDDADDDDDDDSDSQGNDDQDDDNEQTMSDNDGDDFLHPKLSAFDEEERYDEEEEDSDLRVQTPSHFESTGDEACDDLHLSCWQGMRRQYRELMKQFQQIGHRVIPFDNFINNDLAYLKGGASSQTYATSVTKSKAADYSHIKWIEDLVTSTMWSPTESARNVYFKNRIIATTKL
nr:hypothetical protein [Tanacetum cinerariifolium]